MVRLFMLKNQSDTLTFSKKDDNFYHTSQRHITSVVLTAAARLRALLGYNHLFYHPPWEELITNYVRSLVQMVLSDGPAVWTSPPTSTSDLGGRVTPGNMESEAHAAGRMESGGIRGFGVQIEKKKNDKKRWGGYKMGVSDQCWISSKPHEYKAPCRGPDLHGHDSVITRHVPVMGRWLRASAHAFTRIQHTPGPNASMDTTWYSPFLSH